MLYYADRQRGIATEAELHAIHDALTSAAMRWRARGGSPRGWALAHHAELVGAVVALGEIHQGAADLLFPESDDASAETDALAEACILLARCVHRSWKLYRGAGIEASVVTADLLEAAAGAVDRVAQLGLPPALQVRVPEGYAYYSLYPEMYFASVESLLNERPDGGSYVVIGIRSIGTSLASFVAAALRERGFTARVETVRPRGHPFERYINLAPVLHGRLRDARGDSTFLVVDEGPGLTCSSLLSVCSALAALGVPQGRVAVLAAWRGRPSVFASDGMREGWERARVYHTHVADAFAAWRHLVPFVTATLAPAGERDCGSAEGEGVEIEDLSYGSWRQGAYSTPKEWPVIHRATERTKLLFRFEQPVVAKFAGLGRYGREKLMRARLLAERGFSPPVMGLAYGFLLHPLVRGRPMTAAGLSEPLLERMASYYAFVARRFGGRPAPRFDQVSEMILVNTREAIGLDATDFVRRWSARAAEIDGLPLAKLDGRPFPHEWLKVAGNGSPGYLKTDASDHFEDHTLVGEQSALWDVAGASEEWEMSPEQRDRLVTLWQLEAGGSSSGQLLDFFRAAYLAFRTAELHYAIHSTNEEEIRASLQERQADANRRLAALVSA